MRLRRLQLANYGAFDAADVHFATEPGRINLIVAPNGAGKSLLRQAFHDLLFDIPLQSPMKFRHGYAGMALRAEALDATGVAYEFGWVRGAKPPRTTSDEERFAALRRGVTPKQIEQLFALDTAGLRAGGTDLKGGATLAGALLAGTGELAPAKAVRAVIEARRQANWGKGKSKPPLNEAASTLEQARKKLQGAVQRPEARERAERDVSTKQAEYAAARTQNTDALAESRRLTRIRLTRLPLQALLEAEAWLAANPGAPVLPDGLAQALTDAQGEVAKAQVKHATAHAALARLIETTATIEQDEPATQHSGRLAALPGMLGEAEKTAKDLHDRRTELASARLAVTEALRDIGNPVSVDQASTILPTVALLAETRAAITDDASLATAYDLAMARVAQADEDQTNAVAAPDAPPPLPPGLEALLTEIRAERNPVKHAAAIATASEEAEAAVVAALASVPGWSGTAAALRALPVPGEPAVERLNDAHQNALTRHRAAAGHGETARAKHRALSQELQALHAKPLPDTAAIAVARAARDAGLDLVLRHAFSTRPDIAEDRAYAFTEPVDAVFVRHIRQADDLADRRFAELERVERAETLARELRAVEEAVRSAQTIEDAAMLVLAGARQEWADAGTPLGIAAEATITEVRATLAARARLIEAMRKAELAAGARHALAAEHAGWSGRLATLLGTTLSPLDTLLRQADARVAAVRAAETATAQQQARSEAARRAAGTAAAALTGARRDRAEWQGRWDALLLRLGRPIGEQPQATAAVLDTLASLDRHSRTAAALQLRIDGMQGELVRFAETVAALAETLGDATASAPDATARRLIARAERAKSAASARSQADLNLQDARGAEVKAKTPLDDAMATRAAAIAACGAETLDGATLRLQAARDRAEAVSRRDAARRAIEDHGGGLAPGPLRAEAEAIEPEDMPARLQHAEEAAAAASRLAEQLAIETARLQTALDQEADATTALEARADYEAAAAEFGHRLEEQLVMNIAAIMLTDAMRVVEEGLGETSFARVSQTFAAVTAGAYTLETHDGTEGEELHAVERTYPQERKSLDELSEGTRDQLYLALRMVALQEHCRAATPLPFIADDILQTFDDTRARATLVALGALSHDLQIIVLTHHDHLERLAADLDGNFVHTIRL